MNQPPAASVDLDRVGDNSGSPDDALVFRARRGDRDAFALLVQPRAGRLLRTARAILGNEADAYEAAQEALIAAWIRLPDLRDAERFDAWLTRTLVNKCRDALRKRRRVREIDIGGADLTVPDTAESHASQARVLAAFDRLSVSERHILVLHHLHDLPVADIATQLDIPIGTAKSRLWSARRALERALEAEA
jgi:RNA polymerase sigma-70 factor (ECF subfamily)